jgi:hypothetical protein
VGYSIAWGAVQTPDQSGLFEQIQVRPTQEPDQYFESPISGAALNGGWFLLVEQGCNHRLFDRNLLASLLLAKDLTGFKHDKDTTCLAQPTPVVFIDEARSTKPWWKL